ncbi:MAG: adenylate/guanylate cyclase domain-containing protein, partial [Akkermansiaceae bacterium]
AQGQFFQGKIVIIGPAAPTFHDTHTTPVGEIHGAQLHLHALGSYLENTQYKTSPFHSLHGWFISFLLGAVIALVVITRYQRVTSLALIILSICALFVACHYLLISTANTLAGGLHILITSAVVILTVLITQAIAEHARRQELQRHLRRSMSPDVADAIVRAPDGYYAAAQGNRKNVTVLFSDVRGFTERSEEQDPDTLIAQLNQYLAAMVEVVFAHGGTVDKFIGDAIMATWGSLSETDGRRAACNAALAMQRELSKLNAQWSTENLPPFHVGIGIHHGAALVGEIGSNQRTDFTVIGDSVNLASRIESLTKTLQTIILISEETQQGLDSARKNDWIKLGSFQVKGKRQAVCLYGAKPEATATSNTFSSALELFTQGDFTSASSLFSKSKSFGPSQFYLQWLENHPHPPNRWDGTIQMEQK